MPYISFATMQQHFFVDYLEKLTVKDFFACTAGGRYLTDYLAAQCRGVLRGWAKNLKKRREGGKKSRGKVEN